MGFWVATTTPKARPCFIRATVGALAGWVGKVRRQEAIRLVEHHERPELPATGQRARIGEALGIENELGRKAGTIPRRGGTIRHEREPGSGSSRTSECAIGGGVETEPSQAAHGGYELRDVVEPALARALVLAAEAQRWDVVAQIAGELQARRQAGDGIPRARDCANVSAPAAGTTRAD
jgi:hypothetical protein